ncbi:MAG: tRNA epoxyqueuosine(34) reductase QueG, partial [Aeromonas veronii]
AGSFFFLGELLLNLPLPLDQPVEKELCGKCVACINICPTGAIVAPYVVDGRRCISYLTIENDGPIPEEFRPLMGNRIYGCDDCQLICPWNRYADASPEPDFSPRPSLHRPPLLALWYWSESDFLKQTEGSPIRRIGYQRWRRNLAVALGNGPATPEVIAALQLGLTTAEPMVAEHIEWALTTLARRQDEENKKTRLLIRCIEKGLSDHA